MPESLHPPMAHPPVLAMTSNPGPWWLRWLPAESRAGVMRRALVVWGVAAVIALLQSFANPAQHRLDYSLVYSYAISTSIWFFTDPARIALRRWLGAPPPHYWQHSWRNTWVLLAGVVFGYALGTSIGDAYSGRSTWDLLTIAPQQFWSFLLWSAGISAGFLFFFYHRGRARALELQATEARLKLLETQLEPHMLFNTLANLRALIATDPPRAVQMLDRLNDYLRATLAASRTEGGSGQHTLQKEFMRLGDYLELMAVRMGPRLEHRLQLPQALQSHPVPPLLLQPLVENAIRHGLEPQLGGGCITVDARAEGPWLVLEVSDTGVGMDSSAAPAGDGFGLAQVRERVATYAGGRVEVDAALGQGTKVRVWLPLVPATSV